jgi:hypothetical protein
MSGTQDWLAYTINSDGVNWDADTNLIRPNQDLENQIISTIQTIKLANGGEAYVTPETKSNKGVISFFWANTTSTFRSKIESYITSGKKIKIVTHDNQTLIGRFMDYKRVWFSGEDSAFDINATFKESAS